MSTPIAIKNTSSTSTITTDTTQSGTSAEDFEEIRKSIDTQIKNFSLILQTTTWHPENIEDYRQCYIDDIHKQGQLLINLLKKNKIKDLMAPPLKWEVCKLINFFVEPKLEYLVKFLHLTLQYQMDSDQKCLEAVEYLQFKSGVLTNKFFEQIKKFFSLEEGQDCDLSFFKELPTISNEFKELYDKTLLIDILTFVTSGLE